MCYPGWVGGFMSWKKQRRLQGKWEDDDAPNKNR